MVPPNGPNPNPGGLYAPDGAPNYQVLLRASGNNWYYLATTSQPGASAEAIAESGLEIQLVAIDDDATILDGIRDGSVYGTVVQNPSGDTVLTQNGTVIAVKPGDVPAACQATASAGAGRVLSIAAREAQIVGINPSIHSGHVDAAM